jgi:diaminopimelate decarboxylase
MAPFDYHGHELYCEDVPLAKIAEEVGTPVYVYSRGEIERAYKAFDAALAGIPHEICYAVKANSTLGVLGVLVQLGAGADIVSVGELYRWLRAGGVPGSVVFSGVGKTEAEMKIALEAGIGCFNIESGEELAVLDRVAQSVGKRARISIRVNPDVDPETHPYISTGLKQNKFGVAMAEAPALFAEAAKREGLRVVGVDCHIGSQLTKTSPFKDAIARLGELARSLVKEGVSIRYVDIGGGLGIPYNQEDPPSPAEYGKAIEDAMAAFSGLDVTLICEPGRVIVGNAGVLLTRTLYLKQGEIKNFVIVDAAMNDLIRPAFYDSYHAIWPVKKQSGPQSYVADVVGPICETGDFLARDRALAQKPAEGDLLALMSAGAYGFTMSSNYNTRPRAAEVMVKGGEYAVVRKREELEEMLRNEAVPSFVG